ncbi:MAG TPA: ATP-binding cassette domain-containing protein [Phycisphaerae bacterium]|nr:ATP-binding cassette domain-containing protein [Phycisphaerae bacterium]
MAFSTVNTMESTHDESVALRGVTFGYERTSPILRNTDLQIERGSWTVIMGGIGTGKSTILRLMACLLKPWAGTVHVNARDIGFMFQEDGLLPWLSSEGNAAMPRRIRGQNQKECLADALQALEQANASNCIGRFPHELSAGMKKRVELARLILSGADLWLLDEPCESLDLPSRLDLLDLLVERRRIQESTIVMVSHSLDDALRNGTRIVLLSMGQGIKYDRLLPGDVPRSPDDPALQVIRRDIIDVLRDTHATASPR